MTNIKTLICFSLLSFLPVTAFAQTFVVKSDNAQFVDAINGTSVISAVPRGTRIYGLERKDRWVKAVDPKTKTVGWVSRDRHLSLASISDEKKKRGDQIIENEPAILKYGINSRVTKNQLREALDFAKEIRSLYGDLHPITRAAHLTAATVSDRAKAYSTSGELYETILEMTINLYGNKAEKTGDAYTDLAFLYFEQREFSKSARSAKAAFNIYEPILGSDHPRSAQCFILVAHTMYMHEEYKDALRFYSIVEDSYSKGFGEFDLKTLGVKDYIASCYEELDLKVAIALYTELLQRLHDEEAIKVNGEANRDVIKSYEAKTLLKLKYLKLDSGNQEEIDSLNQLIAHAKSNFPDIMDSIETIEGDLVLRLENEGRLGTEVALKRYDSIIKSLRIELRRDLWNIAPLKQNEFLSNKAGWDFFNAIVFAIDNKESQEVCQKSIQWLINGKGIVQETQAMQAGAVNDLSKRETFVNRPYVKLTEITKVLPENGVYVDIIRYIEENEADEKYAAWILDKKGKTTIVQLGILDEIDESVIALKKAILDTAKKANTDEMGAFNAVQPLLKDATEKIWEPIRSKFGDATTVILSPDQTLWLLPWSAMLNPDGKYAIEKYQIQLELSGRDLVRKSGKTPESGPVVFADPDFGPAKKKPRDKSNQRGGLALGSFEQLEYSAKEASLIDRWIKQFDQLPKVYTGKDAVESKFKNLHSPSILVMSTHGYYLDQYGNISLAGIKRRGRRMNAAGRLELKKAPLLKCGLVLTNGNLHTSIADLENDGVLTGLEIAQTDLEHSKLAVLSACQTGVGTLEPTAGVIGMRSAFHAAGVQCVVTTLWPIADEQTVDVTSGFFRTLAKSKNVRRSLQLAQKEQIEKRRQKNGAAHPYFWAAFNVSGDTNF